LEYLVTITNLIILGFVVFYGQAIKEVPSAIKEFTLENKKYQNQSNIQKDAYFRDISGKDIQKLFEEWMEFLNNTEAKTKQMDTKNGKANYIKLQSKTLMYGSEKTVKILAKMMQHFYKNSDDSSQIIVCKSMMYLAHLCSSIKEDFTGYTIAPIYLIESRITDIDKKGFRESLLTAEKEIKKELKE
jgi:hypothetical protein